MYWGKQAFNTHLFEVRVVQNGNLVVDYKTEYGNKR